MTSKMRIPCIVEFTRGASRRGDFDEFLERKTAFVGIKKMRLMYLTDQQQLNTYGLFFEVNPAETPGDVHVIMAFLNYFPNAPGKESLIQMDQAEWDKIHSKDLVCVRVPQEEALKITEGQEEQFLLRTLERDSTLWNMGKQSEQLFILGDISNHKGMALVIIDNNPSTSPKPKPPAPATTVNNRDSVHQEPPEKSNIVPLFVGQTKKHPSPLK